MTKYLSIFLTIFLFVTTSSKSQHPLNMDKYADSLYSSLNKEVNDSSRAATYFKLVTYWTPKDTVKTLNYLEKGKLLGKKSTFLQGMYYAKLGYYYYYNEKLKESKIEYLKADSVLKNTASKESFQLLADIWNNLSVIYQLDDDDEKFVECILSKAIPYAEKAKDDNRLATYYISLGLGFMNLEQYEKAIPYFLKAEKLLVDKENQQHRLISMYNRAAECYLILDKLLQAKSLIEKAKEILKDNPTSDQNSLLNLAEGLYFSKLGSYEKALSAYDKGINKASGPNGIYHIQEINMYKVEALLNLKRFKEALALIVKMENDPLIFEIETNKSTIYKYASVAYKGLGDNETAYNYLKKYSDLNNEIHDKDFKNKINKLEVKYNTEAKEKELLTLKNKEEEAQFKLKSSKQNTFLAVAGMIIFLLIALTTFNYYRSNKRLLIQNEIIHKQKIREQENEAQLTIKNAILESEEQERQRIAQDLHDSMGGMLANIRMSISKDFSSNFKESAVLLQKIDKSISEMRRISRNLMPETLKNLGLEIALKELCDSMCHSQLHIQFEAFDLSNNIPFQTQLVLYRIAQESISNVLKYSQANNVIVQISQNENIINLTIEDDGVGFDKEKVVLGMGLKNIENRVKLINGSFELLSKKGEGTTINIECYAG